jgi:hypothetical protein
MKLKTLFENVCSAKIKNKIGTRPNVEAQLKQKNFKVICLSSFLHVYEGCNKKKTLFYRTRA